MRFLKIALFTISFYVISCKDHSLSKDIEDKPLTVQLADSMVVLPPSWAFGYIYGAYSNQEESVELINEILAHDYPIDAFWIDSWIWDYQNEGVGPDKYLDFVGDTISYPDRNELWSFLEDKNIKAGMWVWDCILKTGNEEVYEDFKSRGFFKDEFINTNSWHNGSRSTIMDGNDTEIDGTWCGNIDFENPKAVAYFKSKMKPFFEDGVDFLKLDRTDAVPVVKTMFELSQEYGMETEGRGFVFSHSHGTESGEYKKYPGKWTDDTRSDWSAFTHERKFQPWIPKIGLKENIAMYTDLDKHYHTIPFLANDMGGFAVSEDGFIDTELYIRWLQFSTFVPLTTPFAQPENESRNFAYKVSAQADTIFRKFAHLKMQLFPYIYTYAHKSRIDGVNTIRPIEGDLYTYFFGENILVAPIYEKGATSREVKFPKGSNWINYWTGAFYKSGTNHTIEAPINQIPLFVKKGAIIPYRKYARSIEAGTNNFIELHIYPGENGNFDLIEDDGISNDYLQGIFSITSIDLKQENENDFSFTIHPIKGYFKNMSQSREWQIIVHTDNEVSKILKNDHEIEFTLENGTLKTAIFSAEKKEKIDLQFN
ncbi:TIM-barrel domain-containing protein [Maribacter sp. 2307ULW6-5]|uniref:glycoside hydrolase family 31 protein n=1 Tax=Maribacter sp. 2307ULW6-5 TaxID=3386275 RepID=UPI0039BCE19E